MKRIANQYKVLGVIGSSHDGSTSTHAATAKTCRGFLIGDDGGEHLGARAEVGIALEAKDGQLARESAGKVGDGRRYKGTTSAMGEYQFG